MLRLGGLRITRSAEAMWPHPAAFSYNGAEV
jgi:hypothetical protein